MSSWEDKVANPDALGEVEKTLWNEIEPLINDLLDELKANGKIEAVYTQAEMQTLGRVLDKLDKFSSAHNTLLGLFKTPDPKPFVDATSKFGFNKDNVVYMYVAAAVVLAVLSTELFKLLLLFHMKNVNFAVSNFYRTMNDAAPNSWARLAPHVDSAFRNSLAHGTYTIGNNQIVLFNDAKLNPQETMSISDFMMRVKAPNVAYQCLINVLVDRKNSGFFTP